MNYTIEMGPRALTYVPSLIKIGSAIQKLIEEYTYKHTHTQTARRTYTPIFIFQKRKVG
jgi:hypothetical protein